MVSVSRDIFCLSTFLPASLCSTPSCLSARRVRIKIARAWWLHWFSQTGQLAEGKCCLLLRGGFLFGCLSLSILPPNMNAWFHFDSERHFLSEVQFSTNAMQISLNTFKRLKLNEVTGSQHWASRMYYNFWGETSRTPTLPRKLTWHNTSTFRLLEGQVPTSKSLAMVDNQSQFLMSHFSCFLWYYKWRCQHKVPRADQSKMAEGFRRSLFTIPAQVNCKTEREIGIQHPCHENSTLRNQITESYLSV